MKQGARRQFDASFKLEVAQMVRDQGVSVAEVCRSLDLGKQRVSQYAAELVGQAGIGGGIADLK